MRKDKSGEEGKQNIVKFIRPQHEGLQYISVKNVIPHGSLRVSSTAAESQRDMRGWLQLVTQRLEIPCLVLSQKMVSVLFVSCDKLLVELAQAAGPSLARSCSFRLHICALQLFECLCVCVKPLVFNSLSLFFSVKQFSRGFG